MFHFSLKPDKTFLIVIEGLYKNRKHSHPFTAPDICKKLIAHHTSFFSFNTERFDYFAQFKFQRFTRPIYMRKFQILIIGCNPHFIIVGDQSDLKSFFLQCFQKSCNFFIWLGLRIVCKSIIYIKNNTFDSVFFSTFRHLNRIPDPI